MNDRFPLFSKDDIREHLHSIFDRFYENHKNFYLRRRSRLPLSYGEHHPPEPTATLDQLVPLKTSVESVQKFVDCWLRHVLPVELFGSKKNFRLFLKKIRLIIELPRTQHISLSDIVRKLKLREFSWSKIPSNRSSLVQQIYVFHLIDFLIEYVFVLVRSFFYVTEASSPSHPLTLVFYRQRIWFERKVLSIRFQKRFLF